MRTGFLADLIFSAKDSVKPAGNIAYLKDILEFFSQLRNYPHERMIHHVKGLYHSSEGFNVALRIQCQELISGLPENSWTSVFRLMKSAGIAQKNLEPVDRVYADRYLYITREWEGWGNKKHPITPMRYSQALTVPFLKAILFIYGAFGMLDLAYDMPCNDNLTSAGKSYLSVYDGLHAVRLTRLGAAVLGVTEPSLYSVPDQKDVEYRLDEDRLFISYKTPDSLSELMLEKYGYPIGRTRVKVDFASFLKGCRDRKEVVEKVEMFKREVSTHLPPVWQHFFEEIVKRADLLNPVDDMEVFQIPTEKKSQLEDIMRDKILRNYLFKAQGNYLLIRRKDLEPVQKRLAELGYLM